MLYRILEYILLPMVAVLIAFLVKSIMASKRMDGREVIIELGYDILIMSVFGLMLNTVGFYAHHEKQLDFQGYEFCGGLTSFICLCGLFGILFFDMLVLNAITDAETKMKKKHRFLVAFGITYIVLLTSVVMYGSYIEDINK